MSMRPSFFTAGASKSAWSALVLCAVVGFAPNALADPPSVLRPGTHPWFVEVAVGPAIFVDAHGATYFQTSFEIGGHFTGDSHGPALGLSADFLVDPDVFVMQTGAKFRWDIQIGDLGLYLAPTIRAGYALYHVDAGQWGGAAHAFNLQMGFEARLVLGDRGVILFRPASVDLDIQDGVNVAVDIMLGGGVIFG